MRNVQDKTAWKAEQKAEKLAQLKKQKAKVKEMAAETALAKEAAPKPVPTSSKSQVKKGLNLSRRDKQLLQIAQKQIKKHHSEELAEEKKDESAEKTVQEAKAKARAAYLARHPRSASHSITTPSAAVSAAVSSEDDWGGWLPKVTLPGSKHAKPKTDARAAAPVNSRTMATEKALQKVGVDGAALKLLASAEKSQSHDTKAGNAVRQRDDLAFYKMAKKRGSIFFDDKARAEARKETRHYDKEATIGLNQATEDDEDDYRAAWRK